MPTNKDSPRSRGGGGQKKLGPEKSASFHGRLPTEHRAIQRPKTQPDLLEGRRASGNGTPPWATASAIPRPAQRVPTKVLVNVTVQRSLGAVQVVASTDWTVGDLVAAVLQQYAKEGRRPLLLPSADPSSFGLHYSQFSLECLEGGVTLMGLGSRTFFLCPKQQPTAEKTCSEAAAAAEKATTSKGGGVILPRLRFMDFLL